jgi:single-strand selective monofunctional uracil DNA glycosylase
MPASTAPTTADELIGAATELRSAVDALRFAPPVAHVYDPLGYAWAPHERYLRRFGAGPPGRVVLVGMNPGPFGMTQTGVPFGEISAVRDWMGIEEPIEPPAVQHPRRPILGFAHPRSEVSGARLWGWARARFGPAESFFARLFVLNYCPLVFLEESGRNVTPDRLPSRERAELFAACDRSLRRAITALDPRLVVGIGTFAEDRARDALAGTDLPIGRVLHPSPASPAANRGWAEAVERELTGLGVVLPGPPSTPSP